MDIDYTSWQYWTLLIGVWALIPLVIWIDKRIQMKQREGQEELTEAIDKWKHEQK